MIEESLEVWSAALCATQTQIIVPKSAPSIGAPYPTHTAVGTNDVIVIARVSNGVFCVVTKRRLKFTFSQQ